MTDKTPTPDDAAIGEQTADATKQNDTDQTGTDTALKGPEQKPGEIGGPKGPEPTRYGDWEFKGRCSDF